MKFMLISYATKDWEAGLPPDPRLLAAIPRLIGKHAEGRCARRHRRACPQLDGREGPGVGREGARDRRPLCRDEGNRRRLRDR